MISATRCRTPLGADRGPNGYPCNRPGKVQRDGRWYCGLHDPERRPRPVYHDDGDTYFCRRCKVSFVKDAAAIAAHERRNPYRHGQP